MLRQLLRKLGFNKPKETILPQTLLVPEPTSMQTMLPKTYTPVEEIINARRITSAAAYKTACSNTVAFYEKKYGIELNKPDCAAICSSVWFALDLWKSYAFVRCAVDLVETRAELVFQIAIINDQIAEFTNTLDVLVRKNGFTSRVDIATVGSRSYALFHIWKE